MGIMLAQSDIYMIDSNDTYILYSFAEFSKLIENNSVDEYIEYGGTLTKVHIKHCRPAKNIKIPLLLEIFLHSLEKSEDARRYGAAITELYEQNELKSVLNK